MMHVMPRTPPPPRTGRRRSVLRHALLGAAALLMLAFAVPAATAQDSHASRSAAAGQAAHGTDNDAATRRQQAAVRHVSDAVGVVHTMSNETGMPALLGRARGVFIVPTYGRAALGVGGAGGAGVLMVRQADGAWGNPVFFDTGGLSIGLQAGVEGGPIALVLLNQKAVDSFRNRNNFSLSADAGLTVVNFARMAQGSTAGDVVAWSGSKGLFGNAATVGINDVRYNQRLTEAYYGKPMTALQAIDSKESNAQADALRKVLGSPPTPAGSGGKSGGR
ncbi:lipid-binding SYLF domain-containing protein [Massilia orientalis]|uniref:lipid-binding SYLF domain-containing protein n=1 Tax=Massilia orientalis TaxID=3050128 RepID=UPI0025CB7150|nr:lipid-binding SYLF domain-containing protein [Massilia sp. YIM B02787]